MDMLKKVLFIALVAVGAVWLVKRFLPQAGL